MTASAAPGMTRPRGNGLSVVVQDDVPERCRDLARLAASPSQNAALSARISLATCLATEQVKPLALCDCEQSVRELDTASAQSVALLDEVVAVGDPAMKILALQAEADLLNSFATRVLGTIPAPIDGSESAVTLHDTRLSLITPLVRPWQQKARALYLQLDTIARANPRLAKNAAVAAAVRSSRTKAEALQSAGTTGVANR